MFAGLFVTRPGHFLINITVLAIYSQRFCRAFLCVFEPNGKCKTFTKISKALMLLVRPQVAFVLGTYGNEDKSVFHI